MESKGCEESREVRGEEVGSREDENMHNREALCTCVFRLLKYTQAQQSSQKAVFKLCRAEQVF